MAAGGGTPELVFLDTVHLDEGDYVLSDSLEPPHYAYVRVTGPDHELSVSASGPFSRERLDLELGGTLDDGDELSAEVVDRREALREAETHDVTGMNFVGVDGSYPGGKERVIRNAARFILGTE